VLTGRWDRMEVPRLFSRIGLVCGEELRVPADADGAELELWRRRLHDALEEAGERAEILIGKDRR